MLLWHFVVVIVFVSHILFFFLPHTLNFSLKQIVACIDPGILTDGQQPEDSSLLQKLESLGASHKIQSQRIPGVVTWQRACVQHDVQGETLQVLLHTCPSEKDYLTGQKLLLSRCWLGGWLLCLSLDYTISPSLRLYRRA